MLKLDLQFFAEGEDDLDIDSMMAEFESEWTDEGESDEQEDSGTDSEEQEDVEQSDESADNDSTPNTQTPEITPNPNDDDADKRNRAFADLRRQADENKKYADFIQKLADDSGVRPEDLLARYAERQLADQAEKQGDSVETLRKLNANEARLAQLEERLTGERLENQINSVKGKYTATDDDIRGTFDYMFQSGVDPRTQEVDFEKFYRAANLDSIIQKEVEKSRQQDLADKKKRQESASIPNGASVTQSNGELSDEDVDAILAKMDIKI